MTLNLKKLARYETSIIYEQSLHELIFLMNLEIQFQKGKLDIDKIEKRMKLERIKVKKHYKTF